MGKIFDAAVLVAYPAIVYFGLTRLGVRWTALILLVLVGRRFIALALGDRGTSRIVILQAVAMAAIIGAAAVSGSAFALRITPLCVSLTFIAQFAASLKGAPLIERFARLARPALPPEHAAYCRRLTEIWTAVLALNSLLLLGAAFIEDEAIWTLVVGPMSYGMLGLVFAIEYLYRKRRFQEFDAKNPLDRLLLPLLGRRLGR